MANFWYTRAARDIARGTLNLHTGGDDIRVIIVMTNTTADTEEDTALINAFTTLDEHDGSGYARGALANEVVNEDTANDRGEFDADDEVFTSLGAGTRAIAGVIVYKHVTDDTDSIPLMWIDTPPPPNSNGGNWTVQWNAQGIGQTQA